jgi:hypothetical protein
MTKSLLQIVSAAIILIVFAFTSSDRPASNQQKMPDHIEARVNTGLALLVLGGLMLGAWRLASNRSK